MDSSLELAFGEILRRLDELDARMEQRFQRSLAALERRGATVELRVGLEQSGATQLIEADNWGGLFDEIPKPDAVSFDSEEELRAAWPREEDVARTSEENKVATEEQHDIGSQDSGERKPAVFFEGASSSIRRRKYLSREDSFSFLPTGQIHIDSGLSDPRPPRTRRPRGTPPRPPRLPRRQAPPHSPRLRRLRRARLRSPRLRGRARGAVRASLLRPRRSRGPRRRRRPPRLLVRVRVRRPRLRARAWAPHRHGRPPRLRIRGRRHRLRAHAQPRPRPPREAHRDRLHRHHLRVRPLPRRRLEDARDTIKRSAAEHDPMPVGVGAASATAIVPVPSILLFCVGTRRLEFHLVRVDAIPEALRRFLDTDALEPQQHTESLTVPNHVGLGSVQGNTPEALDPLPDTPRLLHQELGVVMVQTRWHSVDANDYARAQSTYSEFATASTGQLLPASVDFCIDTSPSNTTDFVPTKCSVYCRSGFPPMLTRTLSSSTPTWVSAEVANSFEKRPWTSPSQPQVLSEQGMHRSVIGNLLDAEPDVIWSKLPWPPPQSKGLWFQLSVIFVLSCSVRKCRVTFLHCVRCHVGLRPQPWPTFNLLDEGSVSWCYIYLWKPQWSPSLQHLIRCVLVTAPQELVSTTKADDTETVFEGTSIQNMVMLKPLLPSEVSRHACLHLWQQLDTMLLCWNIEHTGCNQQLFVHRVISYLACCLLNLVKWKLFLERVSLLQKVQYCFTLANNLKVDSFQSSQWYSTALLFLLNNSSGNASSLTIGTQNSLLHERKVVEVTHIDMTAWFKCSLVPLLMSKRFATAGLLRIGLNLYTSHCIELHPWPPTANLHNSIATEPVFDIEGHEHKAKDVMSAESTVLNDAAPLALPKDIGRQLSKTELKKQVIVQLTWDPGGSELLHRLEGKPKFKKGGMSGITTSWAVIWAMGLDR